MAPRQQRQGTAIDATAHGNATAISADISGSEGSSVGSPRARAERRQGLRLRQRRGRTGGKVAVKAASPTASARGLRQGPRGHRHQLPGRRRGRPARHPRLQAYADQAGSEGLLPSATGPASTPKATWVATLSAPTPPCACAPRRPRAAPARPRGRARGGRALRGQPGPALPVHRRGIPARGSRSPSPPPRRPLARPGAPRLQRHAPPGLARAGRPAPDETPRNEETRRWTS